MSDFTDTSSDGEYYDGSYQSAADTAIATGTTTDYGSSADWTATSYEATDASWNAWGNSLQADSYATEAYYAGDTEASDYWTSVADGYETDSYAAESAADTAWDGSYDAYADESASWAAGDADYSTDYSAYDDGGSSSDSSYSDYSTDYSTDYSAGTDSGYSGYDASSSWAATDTVTDYYTDAEW